MPQQPPEGYVAVPVPADSPHITGRGARSQPPAGYIAVPPPYSMEGRPSMPSAGPPQLRADYVGGLGGLRVSHGVGIGKEGLDTAAGMLALMPFVNKNDPGLQSMRELSEPANENEAQAKIGARIASFLIPGGAAAKAEKLAQAGI